LQAGFPVAQSQFGGGRFDHQPRASGPTPAIETRRPSNGARARMKRDRTPAEGRGLRAGPEQLVLPWGGAPRRFRPFPVHVSGAGLDFDVGPRRRALYFSRPQRRRAAANKRLGPPFAAESFRPQPPVLSVEFFGDLPDRGRSAPAPEPSVVRFRGSVISCIKQPGTPHRSILTSNIRDAREAHYWRASRMPARVCFRAPGAGTGRRGGRQRLRRLVMY